MADLISYGDYMKTLPTYGDYIKTMPTIDEYERQREEEERKKREQEILALYERRLKMIEEERKKFMESQPMAQSVADRYGTDSYAYRSLMGQMEDPNSPLNQQYGSLAQIAQEKIAAQQAAGTGGISYQRPGTGGGRDYRDELIGTAAEATDTRTGRLGPNEYDSSRKALDDLLRIGYQGKRRPAGTTGQNPGALPLPGTEEEPTPAATPAEEQGRRMMGTPGYTQPGNLPANPGKGNGTEIDFLLTGKAKTANAQTAEGARSNAPRSNAPRNNAGVIPNAPAAPAAPAAAAPTPNAPSTPWGTDADSWMRQRMRTSAAAESPAAAAPTAGTPIGTAPALPWQTGTATDWHDTQGVASWVDQVRSMGTYTGNDPMYMSDKQIQENIEKLQQYKEQILADKNKTAAEKQAEIDEINAQLQDLEDQIGVYQRLYYSGVPKTSDRTKWGELGEQDYFKTKPENYDTDDAIKQEYDRMLYDAVHGQGAYDQKMQAEQIAGRTEDYYRDETIRNDYDQKLYDSIYGEGAYEEALARIETDEDVDRFDAEMEKLWEEKENSKKTSLAMEDEIGMLWEDLESGGFRGWMDETQKKKNQIQNKMKQRKPTTEEIDRNIQNYQTELDNRAAKSEWEKKAQEKAKQEGLTGEYNPELVEMGQDALSPYAPQIAHGDLMDQIYYSVNHPETGQRNEENDQNGFLGFLDEQTRTELNIYKHMTQKERETFNILYGSGSEEEKEAAQAYLDTFKNKLSNLQYDYRGKRAEEDASGKYGAIAGLQRINTKPAEGFLGMLGTIKTALGDKSAGDKTSEYYIWAERNNKIQNARRQVWDDKLVEWFGEGARGVGGFLNDGFYSLADMFVAKLISGGVTEIANLDKAGKIAGGIMQLVMSSEATAGTMLEKLEQNMNPQEAALYAFGSGIIEAVTEKYSIEKFLHADIRELLGKNKEFVRYVMKNFIAEGSEEVASDVLNLVMDSVVSNIYGHEDQLMARYRELEKQYGANKASEMVLKEELEQMGTSFLAGGMSSLVSSLAIGANTRTRMYFENRSEAKTANQYGKVNDVIKAAEGIEGDEKYKKKIEDLKKTWDEKGKLTTRETMDLFKTIRETGSDVVESTIQAEAADYSKEQIKAAMEQNGTTADAETIQAASEGAAQLLTGDGELTGKQKKAMQQIPEAMRFVSDMMGEAEKQSTLKERIQKETKSVTDAMNSIRDSTNPYKVRTDVDFGASRATDDDISRAEGTRTNSPLEVIAEGKFGEIVKIETKKVVQDGKTVYQQKAILADGREVDLSDIKGINKTTATVLGFASLDKNRMSSDKFNTTLLQYSKVNPSDTLIKDAMNIRMATLLGKSMPQTNLDQATANALREASQADFDEAEANRVKNNRIIKPGEGKTTFNGVEYGSAGWNKAIKSLSRYDRDQANAIGTLSKAAGINVTIINDPNQDAFFGDESQTGIVINLAGTEADGQKHHAVVTFGHEVTHLLEHSSQEGYAELRKFILSRLEQRGMNVEKRITNLIDLYGAHGVDLDLNGAIAEIVANGCDQVLGDENAIRHLQQTNENLYGKVKGAVMNILDRIKNAIGNIRESQSRESELLIRDMNEIVKKWTGAYDESLTATQNATGTEQAANGTEGNGIQFAIRDDDDSENIQIKKQVNSHLDQLTKTKSIASIPSKIDLQPYYQRGAQSESAAYKMWAEELAAGIDGKVTREGLGEVLISNNAIGTGLNYLKNGPQKAAFAAVPDVIRYGQEINQHEKHKGGQANSRTFAAMIDIDGEPHIEAVVVRYSRDENRYRTHKVFLPDGSVLYLNNKKTEEANAETNQKDSRLHTRSVPDEIVSQGEEKNKTQNSVRLEVSDRRQAALDEAKAAQNELNEIRSQYKALNESKEHQDWIERVSNAGFKSKVVDEYKSWLEKTGLDDLSRRMKEAQERVNKANKEYERIYEEEEVAKEQEAIKKSGLTEEDWRRKEAVKEFGYANNFREAGYMLPNGKMLNFSGEKGRHMNHRGQDHRAISTLYANKEGGNAMIAFMKDGNIRVMAETPGIDIIQEPTAEQYNAIRKMAQQFAKEEYFNVDFTDERGNVIDSIEYDGTVNPTRIVNDIKNFFKTGEAKQPSLVSQFHQFSVRDDASYMKAVEDGDTETAQRMVDKAAIKTGYRIKAYHGTGRADRVGTVFRADRATSGPMAFFTDSREIAENYSKNKIDTSIAYDEEYGDYYTQFRATTKNGKNVPVGQLWNTLSFAEKRRITEAARHITFDDEGDEIIYDKNAKYGAGNFDEYTLHEHKGNAIEALIDGWLESGNLWEREADFLKVMELAGVKGVTWNDPDARVEKVYDTYLKIQNPFDTSEMYTDEFLDGLQEWWDQQDQDQYTKESMGADNWDKNSITVDEWIEDARRDVKEGTTHNWTRIPDGVTAYLKDQGYDGIKDQGGKGGGAGHTVWIPFSSEQIKSAEPVTYDNDGNPILLSERFNPENEDIRYSIRDVSKLDVGLWMNTVNENSLQTEAEKQLLREYRNLRMRYDLYSKRANDARNKMREIEAVPEDQRTKEQKRMLQNLSIREQNARSVAEQAMQKMNESMEDEGFARLMYQQRQTLENFIYGKTQAEVRDSVEAMERNAQAIQKRITKNQAALDEIQKSGVMQKVKSILGTTTVDQAATDLKKHFNSSWSKTQIRNFLDPILLKMSQGEDFSQDIERLASELIASDKSRKIDELEPLRGMTITIGPGQMAELKGQNSSLEEIRRRLAGTGIRIQQGEYSSLERDIDDLRQEFPQIPELGNEKDALENFVSWVEGLKDQSGSEFYAEALADAIGVVAKQAASAASGIYLPTDSRARSQVLELVEYIKGLQGVTNEAQRTLTQVANQMGQMVQAGQAATGRVNMLARDVNVAIDYYNRTAQMAEDTMRKQRTTEIIQQLKSEQAQKLLKVNEEWRDLIERDRQAKKQMEVNAQERGKINTNVTRLYKLLNEPKGSKNIPEELQGLAREIIGTFVGNDLGGGLKITKVEKKQLKEAQRRLYEWEKRDGSFNIGDLNEGDENAPIMIINQDLQTIYDTLERYNNGTRGKNKLDTLQQQGETLKEMSEAVAEIAGYIKSRREITLKKRKVAIQDQAYKVMEGTQGKRAKEWTGRAGQIISGMDRMILHGNMTPEYFFRGLRNEGLSELWDGYHDAENRNGLELKKAQTRIGEIAEKHGYKDWDMKQKVTLDLESGKVDVTLGQLMSLYAIWNREHTLGPEMSQHLEKGGFYAEQDTRDGLIGRQEIQKRAYKVSEEDAAKIANMLTEEQKNFVNDIVGYMSNDMSQLGNEASMAAYGIKMYKESYYFPMQMWDGIKSRKSNEGASAAAAQDRAFHPSFSKSRMHGAQNALVIGDFMQTATDHITGMINYATMGLANENFQKVLNAQMVLNEGEKGSMPNIRTLLEEAYGKEAINYLKELQLQLNGGAVKTSKSLGDKAISLFRKNAVAGSLSVAAQQPLSYIRAASMINPKYLAQGLAQEYWKGSYEERLKHSGVSVIKDMGRFDMNAGQSAREFLMPEGKEGKARAAYEKAAEMATILPELMDRWTWNRMWVAVKAEQKAQHPEMDIKSDEFLDMCGERFNELMRRTQVYDSTLVKSQNMRSDNYWVKGLTSFMAEPTVTLNVLADAVRSAKEGEKGGKIYLGKAIGTFLLSAVAQAAVKAGFSTGRTPDDKKTWLENFLYRFGTNMMSEANPATMIPGYNDLVTLIKEGKLEDDAMGAIGKLGKAWSTGKDTISSLLSGESTDWYKGIEDSAGQIAQLFSNIPAKNIMRDMRAMYNWMIAKPYADRATDASVIKYQWEDAKANADWLTKALIDKLGIAGYDTRNTAYYERIYEAKKAGNTQQAQDMIDYLLNGKGVKQETIDEKMKGYMRKDETLSAADRAAMMTDEGYDASDFIIQQVKAGSMTAAEARKQMKAADPKASEDSIWWKVDRAEYKRDTGNDAGSGYYYRLKDAISANNVTEIKTAVKQLMSHGFDKDKIKDKLSDWKSAYLKATGKEKIAIKNALLIAYKEIGILNAETEIINKWKPAQ